MHAQRFTTLTGSAANVASRRTSLLALGGTALAASGLLAPTTEAKKQARKRCQKQLADCTEQATLCAAQVEQCTTFHADLCAGNPDCTDQIACCEILASCDINAFFACLITASA